MARYDPSDEAWAIIQALIPAQPVTSRARCSWAEHHMIINSMLWGSMVRTTMENRFNRFNRWSNPGVLNFIFNRFIISMPTASLTGQPLH